MLKKIFSCVKKFFGVQTEGVFLPEFNNITDDRNFIFRNEEDKNAFMHIRETCHLDISCHTFNAVNNKGIYLLRNKNKFYVLIYIDDKDDTKEVITFSGIGKNEFVSPLEEDKLDNIFLSKGSAFAHIVAFDSIDKHNMFICETIITFKKILEYVDYSTLIETKYSNFTNCQIGEPILKQKSKPKKYDTSNYC